MGGYNFEIIGVLENARQDSLVRTKKTTPYSFHSAPRKKVAPARGGCCVRHQSASGQINEALTQSEDILRRRRNVSFGDPNNFDIKTADNFVKQFDSITAMVGLIAIAISVSGCWSAASV
jgi:hypothetical protein